MKINTLLATALLLSGNAFSQYVKPSDEFDISVGKPYKVVDAGIKEYFNYGETLMAVKIDSDDIIIQKFNNKSLEQTSIQVIGKEKQPRGFVQEEFLQVNDKLYQFYNAWDKPNETEQIFCKIHDFNSDKQYDDKLILKHPGKLSNYGGGDKIDVFQSFNHAKILMVYREKPKEKRDKLNYDEIGMIVYDVEFNEIWRDEIKMPYTEAEMDNLGYTVDSNGDVFLLARVKKEAMPIHMELIKYRKGAEPRVTKIEFSDKEFSTGLRIKEGINGNIYCAGYYGKYNVKQGIYIAEVSKDGVLGNVKTYEIPIEIINQYKSERQREKNEKKEEKGKDVGLEDLYLNTFKISPDGSITLIGEVYFSVTTTYYNPSTKTTQTKTTYHFDDMLVSKINSDGSLAWMQKVAKKQQSTENNRGVGFGYGMGYAANPRADDLSFRYMTSGAEHFLLYLDNVKNLELAETEVPKRHISGAGGFLTAYRLDDKTGLVSKHSLFDLRDLRGTELHQFSIDRMVQIKEDEFIVEVYKKQKEDILIKIKLTE